MVVGHCTSTGTAATYNDNLPILLLALGTAAAQLGLEPLAAGAEFLHCDELEFLHRHHRRVEYRGRLVG